jgi:hypothetical protein
MLKGMTFIARAALDLRDVLGVGLFAIQETGIRSQSSNMIQPQAGISEARSVLIQHDKALSAVPVLKVHLNCTHVVLNRDQKHVLSIANQAIRE